MKRPNKTFLMALGLTLMLPALSIEAAPAGGHFGGRTRVFIGVGGGWGWGWGGWGWPGYYGPYYGYPPYAHGPARNWAAIDTDISPEEARVYLDGRYIGTADDFDGNPDYLYLGPGRYRLEFRLEGYETLTRDVDARPGMYVDYTDKLRKSPGASRRGSYETPPLPGGIKRYFVKRHNAVQEFDPSRPPSEGLEGPAYDGGEDRNPPPPPAEGSHSPTVRRQPRDQYGEHSAGSQSARGQVGTRLRLTIEPSDAAVYVDNRFVGTAEEVNSLERGISVSAGRHTVTVSRPGFRDKTAEVTVEEGKTETLQVRLGQ